MAKSNVKAPVTTVGPAKQKFVAQETHGTAKRSTANPDLERRPGGSFKATSTEEPMNSGSHDAGLRSAAKNIYAKALKPTNQDNMGDPSMHTR